MELECIYILIIIIYIILIYILNAVKASVKGTFLRKGNVSGCDFCLNAISNYCIKYSSGMSVDSLMIAELDCKENGHMNLPDCLADLKRS